MKKSWISIVALLGWAAIYVAGCKPKPKVVDENWWKHGVFYQIYPRSFKDSDNDGLGDLKGIISKLGHIKDAGVDGAWLSPIYKSPQVDQGYDISDFRDVSEEYGTLQDFDDLVAKAHELGIKVIMDFVPNHSSDVHEWFVKSENREAGYEDYYVWANASAPGVPPNNWLSQFKYSAWEYSEKRGQYYLHKFDKGQPDLNYRNPKLVQEMKDILTFWMDRGVDGFRIDAVPYLFEDAQLRDEPPSNDPNAHDYDDAYLSHIYTQDQPETFDMICQWRAHVDKYSSSKGGDARILMTEAYTDIATTMKYYGDGCLGAHFTFNFNFITDLSGTSTARDVVMAVKKWLAYMPLEYTANWVLGNHDNHRVATRLGVQNADGYNMLVALLPGVGITFNGEEIGMEDGEVTFIEGIDPNACTDTEENFPVVSRDFERTPFHWDNSTNAGFNEGHRTWLPVSKKYATNNLAAQSVANVASHYHVYQALISLRGQSEPLKNGILEIEPYSDRVLTLQRKHEDEIVVLAFNIGEQSENVDLTQLYDLDASLQVLISSVSSSRVAGTALTATNIVLEPHESLVAYQRKSS